MHSRSHASDSRSQRNCVRRALIVARQHHDRMREVHDHRHVEVQIRENGMREDLEEHEPFQDINPERALNRSESTAPPDPDRAP